MPAASTSAAMGCRSAAIAVVTRSAGKFTRPSATGRTGPRVTLHLALRLARRTAGRTFTVEVAATDKMGNDTGFLPAGSLVVSAK